MEENINLQPYNTFGIACTARYLVRIHSTADLQHLLQSPTFQQHPHLILGSGSNVLFTETHFAGLVLKNEIGGIETVRQTDTHTTLRVGSGVVWTSLVAYCLENDLGGVENLSLIPGTTGAAPVQNIGAYGVEIRDVLDSVEVVDLRSGEVRCMSNRDCGFGYRDSVFKHQKRGSGLFITAVVLSLSNQSHHRLTTSYTSLQQQLQQSNTTPTIRAVSEAVCTLRRTRLPSPAVLGNAGSFFQNPSLDPTTHQAILKELHPMAPVRLRPDGTAFIPAAWLIEQCGWRGGRLGDVGVYPGHALVLVNYGTASGADVARFAKVVCAAVEEAFGIRLTPEVNIIS